MGNFWGISLPTFSILVAFFEDLVPHFAESGFFGFFSLSASFVAPSSPHLPPRLPGRKVFTPCFTVTLPLASATDQSPLISTEGLHPLAVRNFPQMHPALTARLFLFSLGSDGHRSSSGRWIFVWFCFHAFSHPSQSSFATSVSTPPHPHFIPFTA
jgi:hypothetical protein